MHAIRMLLHLLFVMALVLQTGCSISRNNNKPAAVDEACEIELTAQGRWDDADRAIGFLVQSGIQLKDLKINELTYQHKEFKLSMRTINAEHFNKVMDELRLMVEIREVVRRGCGR